MHQKWGLSGRSRSIVLTDGATTIAICLKNTVLSGCLATRNSSADTKRYLLSSLRNKMLLRPSNPRSATNSRPWLHPYRHTCSPRSSTILLLNCASFRIRGLLALHAEAAADLAQLLGWPVLEDFRLLKIILCQNVLHNHWFNLISACFGCSLLGFHRFYNDNKYYFLWVFVRSNTLKMIILLNSKFMLQN